MRQTLARTPLITRFPCISFYQQTVITLWVSGYQCQLKSYVQWSSKYLDVSLSTGYSAILSGEGLRELLLCIPAMVLQDPPLRGHGFLFIQWIPGLKSGQGIMAFYWGNCLQSLYHPPLFVCLFVCLFFDGTMSSILVGCSSILPPETLCSINHLDNSLQISGPLTLLLTTVITSSWLLTIKYHIMILPLWFQCFIHCPHCPGL